MEIVGTNQTIFFQSRNVSGLSKEKNVSFSQEGQRQVSYILGVYLDDGTTLAIIEKDEEMIKEFYEKIKGEI